MSYYNTDHFYGLLMWLFGWADMLIIKSYVGTLQKISTVLLHTAITAHVVEHCWSIWGNDSRINLGFFLTKLIKTLLMEKPNKLWSTDTSLRQSKIKLKWEKHIKCIQLSGMHFSGSSFLTLTVVSLFFRTDSLVHQALNCCGTNSASTRGQLMEMIGHFISGLSLSTACTSAMYHWEYSLK